MLLSDERAIVGTDAGVTAGTRAAGAGEPMAALLESGAESGAAGALPNPSGMVQEFLPINDGEGDAIAVVALWRDAADLMARLDATRRDIMLVTLAAAVILAGILFLVFRAAQARLTRQHRQLIEATRRDALTGMLNHGAVVALLAEEIERARSSNGRIGVALVDVDNFRLFNDTHGHAAADQVLLKVAALVTAEARWRPRRPLRAGRVPDRPARRRDRGDRRRRQAAAGRPRGRVASSSAIPSASR